MNDHKFVVVTLSGRAENYKEGSTYWSILDSIYTQYQSAGGNWDRPNMLLLDGAVVIASNLSEHAWNYGKAKYERTLQAVQAVQDNQMPDFLKGDKA